MKKHGFTLIIALLLLLGHASPSFAQGLLVDDVFDYPVGSLEAMSGGNWENFEGAGSLIDLIEGDVTYDGYGTMQGNKVMLDGSEGFNLLARRFGAQTSGAVYAAALIRVDQGVPGFQANRFLSFNVTPRFVNLAVLGDGGSGDAFRLCVSKANVSSGCTGTLAVGTYLVVFSYIFNGGTDDDVARLWVNPDLGQPEPAPDEEDAQGADATMITEVVIEQGDDLPVMEVDELRVATAWADLGMGGNTAPGQPVISEPQEGITQTLTGDPSMPFVAAWSSVTDPDGDPVSYTWQLSADAFTTFLINADTDSATRYETTFGDLAALLDASGVNLNETVMFSHRVLASDGQATSASATQTFSLTRGTLTATEEETIPDAFALSPVYPNPFNPEARFTLTVAQAQPVCLAVYDVIGREVAVLYEGILVPGKAHTFMLQGRDLPSGLYLIRAVGETFAEVRRAMLMK